MGRRSKKSTRCPGCGRFLSKNENCGNCSSHHWRPRSRGGTDYKTNLAMIPDKDGHRHLHTLFANDRLSEVVGKMIMNWDTVCPHREVKEKRTNKSRIESRKKTWEKLFGKRRGRNRQQTLDFFINQYVARSTEEDKLLTIEVLRKGVMCKELSQEEFESLCEILKE